ncbi:MAG TPA: phage holin family protein [Anaeromyxobacter sp.]
MTPLGREEWGRRGRLRYDARDLRERPLADLVRELVQEGQGLLRDEVRLAKAEVREEARKASKGAGAIGAGGAALHAALLFLGVTLVLLGATLLPAWFAALVVTAIYAGAGWAALSYGRQELRRTRPSGAVEHVKEDARWAKETMRDIRSSRSANA